MHLAHIKSFNPHNKSERQIELTPFTEEETGSESGINSSKPHSNYVPEKGFQSNVVSHQDHDPSTTAMQWNSEKRNKKAEEMEEEGK